MYQMLFWLLAVVFGIVVTAGGFFIGNWVKRIDENFRELFAKLDYMAEQKDMDKVVSEIKDLHDRVVKMEIKVQSCKACNS